MDCSETNHLFTSLQVPLMVPRLYSGILHEIKVKIGKAPEGQSMPVNEIDTVLEEDAHDDVPEELVSGKIFAAFGMTAPLS